MLETIEMFESVFSIVTEHHGAAFEKILKVTASNSK